MTLIRAFFEQSLLRQFVLAGGLVMLAAAIFVGSWVAGRIEQGVVQNSATSAALYMESYISPLSADLSAEDGLSDPARAALREIFLGTALGDRVVSYKIWKEGGRIVEASNPELSGKVFPPSADQLAAWEGQISASFEDLSDLEDAAEAALGIPLLEVYSPVREVWTGEIVAVAEFYEHADALALELADARRKSWLIVFAVFALSGLLLIGIVRSGSLLIDRQQNALKQQLVETQRVSDQNSSLKDSIAAAAQRSTAQADRVMQRIGQDLHDGVAQYLSLASLRFEEAEPKQPKTAETVRKALDAAMTELRAISRGMALPDLDDLSLRQTIDRAIQDHRNAYQSKVTGKHATELDREAPYSMKLCVYRFLQEALGNTARYAEATKVSVTAAVQHGSLICAVTDNGSGFDPESAMVVRPDGGQGLLGLRDRAATLGGQLKVDSDLGIGSRIMLSLPLPERSV
ncbi:ATP-binding protein [uncultured Tateyamaria sp.]|uniref:sensor histidine kinase n=1 Tax=uncultured Tateyamaria sp. TaxID=455651 RepID=UPI00261A6C3B|nr:ATP-binding protein [uncultured Tateyamaria sp.]